MAVELVPLCTATLQLKDPILLGPTPSGLRVVGELAGGRFEGDRLQASIVGSAGADWLLVGSDNVGKVDVRVTLRTDDHALIGVTYLGRLHVDTLTVFTSPLFETADERYAWLNRIQAVAKGNVNGTAVVYDIHEVR
jgi:hypothetical protein